jgi:hypothetical protein
LIGLVICISHVALPLFCVLFAYAAKDLVMERFSTEKGVCSKSYRRERMSVRGPLTK